MVPKTTNSSPETALRGPNQTAQRSIPSPINWETTGELPKDAGLVDPEAEKAQTSERTSKLDARFAARRKELESKRKDFENNNTPRLSSGDLNSCSAANPLGRALAAPLSSDTPAHGTPVINFNPADLT